MICPKCGLEQPEAVECKGCGVIVAKHKTREQRPTQVQPAEDRGGSASSPVSAPGWARDPDGPAPAGGGGSRYAAVVDTDALRRVQAQTATKRFFLVLIVIGVAVALLSVFAAVFGAYYYMTKLELDVTADASELTNMTPDGVRNRVREHASNFGFTIKDDKIRILMEDLDGKPLAKMLLGQQGIEVITAKVTIEFVAIRKAMGIPIEFKMKASTTITRRAILQEFRRWAYDEYGEGKVPDESEPEPEPEPTPESPPETPYEAPSEPSYPENPQGE